MDKKQLIREHARSFVGELDAKSPILKLGEALVQQAQRDPASRAAIARIHECIPRVSVSKEMEALHERVGAKWSAPKLEGLQDVAALLLTAAYMRARDLLNQQPSFLTSAAQTEQIERAAKSFEGLLEQEPGFFDELVLELDAKALEGKLSTLLQEGAEELRALMPDLEQLAQSMADAMHPGESEASIGCTVMGNPAPIGVCIAIAIIIIIIIIITK